MTTQSNEKAEIIRTERGLTIAGTRITLYQLMDYIHAGYPPNLLRHKFYITDQQFDAAISYIETYRAEVEAEYQIVLQQAEEIHQYWENRNRERFAKIATISSKPEQEAIRAKLNTWKAKIESRT